MKEKRGKCPYCGEMRTDLLPTAAGDLRCSDCDSSYEWCGICEEDQSCDSHCRHIFRAAWGEFLGSGARMSSSDMEYVCQCFKLLLDLMPQGFAQALRQAIASGEFYTWASLPMIGGGGSLMLNGMPQRHGNWAAIWWGDFLMDIGEGKDAEDTADGYHWLASLYKRATLKANKITIAWLDGYIALERAARIYGRAA